jgi:hypothetical protein
MLVVKEALVYISTLQIMAPLPVVLAAEVEASCSTHLLKTKLSNGKKNVSAICKEHALRKKKLMQVIGRRAHAVHTDHS